MDWNALFASPAFWGFVGVVLGTLITGIVTIGGEILRGRAADRLDRAKRKDDRMLGRAAFQRETLLGLQDTARSIVEVAAPLLRPAPPDDLVQRSRLATMDLVTLASRSAHGGIKLASQELIDCMREVGGARQLTNADRDDLMARLSSAAHSLIILCGTVITQTWPEP